MSYHLFVKDRSISAFLNRPTDSCKAKVVNSFPIRQPFFDPGSVLIVANRDIRSMKTGADQPPNAPGNRALEEQVVDSFNLITEDTGGIPQPLSSY